VNAATSVSAALNNGASARLPKWANTLLVVGIGVALAFVTLKALPAFLPTPEPTNHASTGEQSLTGRQAGPDVRKLALEVSERHLFGDFSKPVAEAPKDEPKEELVESRLNIKLAGVFAYTPIERAIAILSVDNGDQTAYKVGSKIIGETTLEEVYPDHIIIDNRGKREKVLLSEAKPLPASQIQQARVQNSGNNTQAGADPNAPVQLPSSNPKELRDFLARNPAMLGRIVAAEPYQENGKLRGYRITPKQNPEILEAQGIIAGDVITSVNNIQINSQKQGIRALRNVVKAQQLDVTILRDGVEVPITISLN